MADRDDLADSFLAPVDEAFRRLLDEPDAHLHVTGFAEGNVAFVLIRDGLEVRRRAEVYGSENSVQLCIERAEARTQRRGGHPGRSVAASSYRADVITRR